MYSQKVKEFVKSCVDKLPDKPRQMTNGEKDFIIKMINEEVEELKLATTLEDEIDALIDIIYYIVDRSIKNGIDLDPIFNIVHQANMRKIVNGKVLRRADGKIIKPPHWQGPEKEITEEIKRQSGT